ncbi:hypothetical protein EG834_18575, partial [bacterium]|nr:hypothetical protein [bacterium]
MSPSPVVHRVGDRECWGTLRAVTFHARPAHADQLNVDLWWHGRNIAQDAGTYLYNAPPPWDNTLGKTYVHNTLTVNGMDQMERAGKFLWLDRLNAAVLTHMESNSSSAQMLMHTRPPLHHRRT